MILSTIRLYYYVRPSTFQPLPLMSQLLQLMYLCKIRVIWLNFSKSNKCSVAFNLSKKNLNIKPFVTKYNTFLINSQKIG